MSSPLLQVHLKRHRTTELFMLLFTIYFTPPFLSPSSYIAIGTQFLLKHISCAIVLNI